MELEGEDSGGWRVEGNGAREWRLRERGYNSVVAWRGGILEREGL